MLNQQIREVIQQFRNSLPPEFNALIEQGAGEISALGIVEKALKPGDHGINFRLPNQQGVIKSLNTYLLNGPLVVTFYRGVWCPYCNLQLNAYADRHTDITRRGATLVAISPEKPDVVELLKQNGAPQDVIDMAVTDVPFDVLYDQGNLVSSAFGLQFKLPDSHHQLLEALNVDLEALTGDNSYTFPDPATYVINTDGIIEWSFVPNNYRKRAEVEDILQALDRVH